MKEYIKLDKVLWLHKAMDGTFCTLPYPNHPRGCPNFPKCVIDEQYNIIGQCSNDISNIMDLEWYVVIEEFNLEEHIKKMKEKHPDWTELQCKCVLYWQNKVQKKLRQKTERVCKEIDSCCYTLKPEALGINVFGTMAKVGIILYKNPKLVRKIAFIGKKK